MTYEHRTAYRHENGDVEGFRGTGRTKARAKADAMEQIIRKLNMIADLDTSGVIDTSRIVTLLSGLNSEERDCVRGCWNSGVRY